MPPREPQLLGFSVQEVPADMSASALTISGVVRLLQDRPYRGDRPIEGRSVQRSARKVLMTPSETSAQPTAFLFDLDGTLVDSVYQHVLAWREALDAEGIALSVWRVHRRIGMSGGLFTNMLLRETGLDLDPARIDRLQKLHAAAYKRHLKDVRPLPGAKALLAALTANEIPWAVATSGRLETAAPALETLGIDLSRTTVITRDQVRFAKPDPDLFLAAAASLRVPIQTASVVGDSVWDMLAARRARALGIGLLSGGYGTEELERAGAYRVFEDPADLLNHLDEVGGRR
jgi:HAD superfamily hydrolase (TIGR01509 family)